MQYSIKFNFFLQLIVPHLKALSFVTISTLSWVAEDDGRLAFATLLVGFILLLLTSAEFALASTAKNPIRIYLLWLVRIVLRVHDGGKHLLAHPLAAGSDTPSGELPAPVHVKVADVVLPQLGDDHAPLVFAWSLRVSELLHVQGMRVDHSVGDGLPEHAVVLPLAGDNHPLLGHHPVELVDEVLLFFVQPG